MNGCHWKFHLDTFECLNSVFSSWQWFQVFYLPIGAPPIAFMLKLPHCTLFCPVVHVVENTKDKNSKVVWFQCCNNFGTQRLDSTGGVRWCKMEINGLQLWKKVSRTMCGAIVNKNQNFSTIFCRNVTFEAPQPIEKEVLLHPFFCDIPVTESQLLSRLSSEVSWTLRTTYDHSKKNLIASVVAARKKCKTKFLLFETFKKLAAKLSLCWFPIENTELIRVQKIFRLLLRQELSKIW